jgi:uncharacterized protein YndB with AHSA1/START domain
MYNIYHNFSINASPDSVYKVISTPQGLDKWWSKNSSGNPGLREIFQLDFGPDYNWQTKISIYKPDSEIEYEFVNAQNDWLGTRVSFFLEKRNGSTQVYFKHTGWTEANEHYKISCYCWAMYLRLIKRYIEYGEFVKYEDRLEA